jgi:hypothetical protein
MLLRVSLTNVRRPCCRRIAHGGGDIGSIGRGVGASRCALWNGVVRVFEDHAVRHGEEGRDAEDERDARWNVAYPARRRPAPIQLHRHLASAGGKVADRHRAIREQAKAGLRHGTEDGAVAAPALGCGPRREFSPFHVLRRACVHPFQRAAVEGLHTPRIVPSGVSLSFAV